jgi:poly(A) polymerase
VAFTDDWKEDAARRDFTINALSADPVTGKLFDYFGGIDDLQQRRIRFIGDPLQRIAEDHLRILRFFRFHARFDAGEPDPDALAACTARANDLMALSRERIADELLKLLAVEDPVRTIAIMLDASILRPVLPEITKEGLSNLQALIENERAARVPPDALRRLAALLPPDSAVAEDIASRLRLSNKARKRLSCAVTRSPGVAPRSLAYRHGTECTVDRLLIAGEPAEAAAIARWSPPRLPISGGALIGRGLVEGPIVARTLRRIEERWVADGFPTGEDFERIVDDAIRTAA